MTYKAPNREALQAECDAFNFECRVGSRVAVRIDGRSKPLITTTRSPAQILSGHSAVVWLDGVSGCYHLSHVTPIPAEPVEGEAWAVLADSGNVIYWSHSRPNVAAVAEQHGRPYAPYMPRASQPFIGKLMTAFSTLPTLFPDGCREPGALVRHGDVFKLLVAAGKAAAQPLPAWTTTPPTEQGEYWHWNGDPDSAPTVFSILYSGTAKKCFVPMNQSYTGQAIMCDVYGGHWLRIECPELPRGSEAEPA